MSPHDAEAGSDCVRRVGCAAGRPRPVLWEGGMKAGRVHTASRARLCRLVLAQRSCRLTWEAWLIEPRGSQPLDMRAGWSRPPGSPRIGPQQGASLAPLLRIRGIECGSMTHASRGAER